MREDIPADSQHMELLGAIRALQMLCALAISETIPDRDPAKYGKLINALGRRHSGPITAARRHPSYVEGFNESYNLVVAHLEKLRSTEGTFQPPNFEER